MKAMPFLLSFLFLYITGFAQQNPHSISGIVKDNRNESIPGATVQLLSLKDSVLKSVATNGEGRFMLDNVTEGSYAIKISAIGQLSYHLPVMIDGKTSSLVLPVLILKPEKAKNLAEVVVQGKKPLVQMEIDKTVVNVESMISSASRNTLEILEKTPGVTVSSGGDIGLNGRSSVLVLIDGRSTYMSGQDLALYLKSIPGSLLDKIELMDNPSARYDAAGNAVINIRLKKNRIGGFTGSISTGFTQGKYLKSNNGMNLNYNYKKINVFGNLGYSYNKGYTDDQYDRRYYDGNENLTSAVSILNSQQNRSKGINSNLGIDYAATENTTYGFQFNLNDTHENGLLDYTSRNFTSGTLDSTGRGNTRSENHRKNLGTSLSFIHKFGKTGRELSVDANYLNYNNTYQQSLDNFVEQPGGLISSPRQFFYDLPLAMDIYTLKADYVHPFSKKAKLEAGFKSSWVDNDNINDYYNTGDGLRIIDNSQSNHFKYRENINAGYVNTQKNWRYFGLQLGLRVENTVAKGDQMGNAEVSGSSFSKNYTRLFPALFFSYKLDTVGTNTFSFALTRRINRPNYQLLNAFQVFRDQYSYTSGNEMLNPQYQYRYELKYQYKQLLRMGLSYNHFTDLIFQTTTVDGEVFITRPENVGTGYMLLLNTGLSLSPARWWSLNSDVLLSRMGLHGVADGLPFNPKTYVARINVLNQFQIGSGWSAEFGGYYASRDLNGQAFTGGMYRLNTGVQKKIFKGQGTVSFGADDILHSWVYHNSSVGLRQASFKQISTSDTQRFGFAFSYRFGKDTFSRKNKHQNNALDEEKGRM